MSLSSSEETRFGKITERRSLGGGSFGNVGLYYVEDGISGEIFSFDYRDIVTEGFRTVVLGERVRFYTDHSSATRARYVIRLDLPGVEEYYAT